MKKILAILALALSFQVSAQQRIDVPLPVKWNIANAVSALLVGWFVLPAAVITGQQKELCDLMHGKYDPAAADKCEGGDWVRVIPWLRDLRD
jgi:hypothetical protein